MNVEDGKADVKVGVCWILSQQVDDLRDTSSSLSLPVARFRRHRPSSTATIVETTTAPVLVEATSSLIVATEVFVAAATATYATSLGHIAPICVRTRATLFNEDLLPTNIVRIRCNSSVVCRGVRVLDKCAILAYV